MRRNAGRIWAAPILVAALSAQGWGCVYYNAMWHAERFAKNARRLEAHGQEAEARAQWARVVVKAESVAVRHPRSRWADDAIVLHIEGLAGSGSCAAAAAALAKARDAVRDVALRERAGLAGAQCALVSGKLGQVDDALSEALASRDQARRSRAEYLAGQAALLRTDYESALAHFRRSRDPGARLARARALLASGQATSALTLIDTLADGQLREAERAELFAQLASAADVDAASAALDRHVSRARLPFAEHARLLIADGDRQLAAGHYDAAVLRYRRAALVATSATSEASVARIREQRVAIARAQTRDDLGPVTDELARMTRGDAVTASSAQGLLNLLTQVMAIGATPGARFRAAELARDSLGAPALAGQLYLDAAASDSASLYAPKALVAALSLLPDRHDSIASLLDTRYSASPYTRAYHGEASVAYAAAEDSLASEMGVQIVSTIPVRGRRLDAPRPGPRGPSLDDAPATARAARPAQPRRATDRNQPRDRPTQPERP